MQSLLAISKVKGVEVSSCPREAGFLTVCGHGVSVTRHGQCVSMKSKDEKDDAVLKRLHRGALLSGIAHRTT